MKEKFNKDTENLKKNQIEILEMKSSVSQTKISAEKSPVDWTKLKTEYQGLETRQIYENMQMKIEEKKS
jgi:hypothetical protein